jgi:hypothetical protein
MMPAWWHIYTLEEYVRAVVFVWVILAVIATIGWRMLR